jgi:hypothetical protein
MVGATQFMVCKEISDFSFTVIIGTPVKSFMPVASGWQTVPCLGTTVFCEAFTYATLVVNAKLYKPVLSRRLLCRRRRAKSR